jgi:hypothetical protein
MGADTSAVDILVSKELVSEFGWDVDFDFEFEERWKEGLDGSCHFFDEEGQDMISEYCRAMN